MKKSFSLPLMACLLSLQSCNKSQPAIIDLSGKWQFQMDPNDVGEQQKWFEKNFQKRFSFRDPWWKTEKDRIFLWKQNGQAAFSTRIGSPIQITHLMKIQPILNFHSGCNLKKIRRGCMVQQKSYYP